MPEGEPCKRCGLPGVKHRVWHKPSPGCCALPPANHYVDTRKRPPVRYWGIDGEGQGRVVHRYVMLAACDEDGSEKLVTEAHSLSTVACLEFLLSLPGNSKFFAYSFMYDLTKMLVDLPNKTLYLLFHEELRQRTPKQRHLGPRPIQWGEYWLNLQRTKFSVRRGKHQVVIWDIWRFFQGKFVTALENWGLADNLESMRRMKEQRSEFDKLSKKEIRAYCWDECQRMGQLARKLVDAHDDCGLKLRNFYGAGSTGSALLNKLDIKTKRGDKPPEDMTHALACAFFGGRFENSIIGPYPGPVYSYDISSAYPYHITFLPCLQCGKWTRTTNSRDLEHATTAIVRYSYSNPGQSAWHPFPYRTSDGSICFPNGSSGWVWLKEYQAGKSLFPGVSFREAWVYRTSCDCRPFREFPNYYRERVRLGKEAAGIVLKLGMNSCYGKLAQSIGINPPFQSWVWAGMITAGCRAQVLELAARLESLDDLLMVATDGVYTSKRVSAPLPLDTGTSDLPKPLGGWEEKIVRKGIFAARPGIYFPLDPSEAELKEVRARGLGKSVLHACWSSIVDAYGRGEQHVLVDTVTRFCGAKSSISVRGIETGNLSFHRSPEYGQWVKRPIDLSFNPMPKRESVCDGRLKTRTVSGESAPYVRALSAVSPETIALKMAEIEAEEQPDGGDISDYF